MSAPARTAPRPAATASADDRVLAVATATVAGGVLLTTLPLRSIFTDWTWLTVSILCALPYLAVVAGLRLRGGLRGWHTLTGLLASVLMLIWVFVPQHLLFGVLPTTATVGDIRDLIEQAQTVMRSEHAPLPSTAGLRLLVCSALVGLVVLTDVLGIVLRRPLLASAPLLEVLAVASATSGEAAHPVWFVAAAIGFLIIVLAGTRLQDRAWGPSVDGSAGRLGGARRMAVTGVLAALIVPLALPSVSVNVLSRAAHHGSGGDGPGNGQTQLNTFASLRGSLRQPSPIALLRVQVDPNSAPFYIRQAVLDQFTNTGWQQSGNAFGPPSLSALDGGDYPSVPANQGQTPTFNFNARFTVLGLGGTTLPLLANPTNLQAGSDGAWNARTDSVIGVNLRRNMTYAESVQQPAPTLDQLRSAPDFTSSQDRQIDAQLLSLPAQPREVTTLAAQLTQGLSGPYAKARAISDYFTNGKNGFVYSLNAPADDGRAALVTFLDKKQGFCQQYAAAAAVLMRQANIPARVVIGYTHETPDAAGDFTVTTSDAHAWVEAFFDGIGWVAFDPTPLTGADATRVVPLPWATHAAPSTSSSAEPTARPATSALSSSAAPLSSGAAAGGGSSTIPPLVLEIVGGTAGGLLVLAAIVFGPRLWRSRQRRKRLGIARATGNPELLWTELAATATDRDALWPTTLTVSQVPDWLARHGVDERGRAAVTAIAETVQADRFSAHLVAALPEESILGLDQALTRWARRADRRQRLINRWIPRSLLDRPARWRR